jgi:hypothetical protein
MTILVGHRGISGGVYWQITQSDDPGVLTMVFPEQVATDAAVPDVSPPEVGQEAWTLDLWTLDFDAVRAHLGSQFLFQFPAWTSGQVSATPSEGGPSVRFDITPEMIGRLQYNPNFALRLSEKWSEGVSGPLSVARNSDQWRVLLL